MLAVLLLLTGCRGERPANGGGGTGGASGTESPAEVVKRATNVEILHLRPQDFSVYKTYVGNLLPRERVEVRAELDGVVEAVSFDEGLGVQKGQILAKIATKRLGLRRDLARSNLRLAEANLTREKRLFKENLISRSQLDRARNQRDVAFYTLETAGLNLNKSVIRAPLAGLVKTRAVEPGEYVEKGQQVGEILDMVRMRVQFHVPERQIGGIREGMPAEVLVEATGGGRYPARVQTVGLQAGQRNRSFPVEVTLDNPGGVLRSGMLGRVRIETGKFSNAVLVPRYALLEREAGRAVFVVTGNTVEERPVKTGADQGGAVQIVSGLELQDVLVVRGQQNLVSGDAVRIRGERTQRAGVANP